MKTADLRELKSEELIKKIDEAQVDLAEMKFKHSMNQLENPMLIRKLRKEIARMSTILAEK